MKQKNNNNSRYLILASLVAMIILSGCAKSNEVNVPSNVKATSSLNFVEYPNKPIPSFKLVNQNGTELTNENMKSKVYIIQGYSFGCSSCAAEVAVLSKVWERYADKGVEIISMDLFSEDIESALETKEVYNGGDWHWTLDTDNVAVKLEMASLETTIIVDKKGIIRYKDEIISNADDLSEELDKIIN